MAEWRQADWRKSHRRGVTSESLLGIGPNARALFWTLFTCAWWDEESPEGRMLESPDPTDAKSIEALGVMSDLTQGQARTALERLRRKHIVAIDDHGVITLPKFRKWQRGESYERVKKHRSSVSETPRETDNADSRQQTADADQPPPTPPVEGSGGLVLVPDVKPGRRGAGKRPPPKPDERAAAVLDRVDFHRVRLALAPMTAGQRTAKTITSRLREGASLEQCLAVVDAFGRLADREPGKRTLLNATTPFTGASSERGGGWAWGLRMLDEETASGVRQAAPTEMPEWMRDA